METSVKKLDELMIAIEKYKRRLAINKNDKQIDYILLSDIPIESHLVNDFPTTGVIKILRSLLPFPTTISILELTWSIFNVVSSDNLKAQFRKIVII